MAELDVDVLVIGWGKGGKTLAGALGRQGTSVALVERSRGMYGGGCINIACVPTKDLIHSAQQRRGDDPQLWFAGAQQERDALTDRLRARNYEMLAEVDAVTLIDGAARFVGPREVEIAAGEERLRVRAATIIVNTGTAPAWPPIPGIDESARVHDSATIQHIDPLPRRLVIVGGGYVGLEFAGMFAQFGSAVTVVDRNEIFLRHEDRDVAEAVQDALAASGAQIMLDAVVQRIDDTATGVAVRVARGGEVQELTADAVLVATGRHAVTSDLDLDAAGVATDERGFIVVDEHLRTSAPGVFAVGDVNGGPQFTYISMDDHRVILSQLTGDGTRTTADRVAVPTVTFLTPPLARVGMSEADAREDARDLLIAVKDVADIAAMPRPKIVGETRGLIKLIVDPATDLVLGATVLSIDAQEVINLVALAMRAGVTATELRDGIWTHPSSTEALNEVLGALQPLR